MNKHHLTITLLVTMFADAALAKDTVRDPTAPLGYQYTRSENQASLNLQAIFGKSGDIPKAIINGTVLSVGQAIAGWRLVDIQSGQVVLQSRNTKQTLHLRKSVTN